MNELLIKLRNTYERPVIYARSESGQNVECLIDTGSHTPVWTEGGSLLCDYFPSAKLCDRLYYFLGGFGGKGEKTPVYIIPMFVLSDDVNHHTLTYKNLAVACCERNDIGHSLILSATMFKHTNYEILNIGVDSPVMKIRSTKNEFQIGIRYNTFDKHRVTGIYSFSEENGQTFVI